MDQDACRMKTQANLRIQIKKCWKLRVEKHFTDLQVYQKV